MTNIPLLELLNLFGGRLITAALLDIKHEIVQMLELHKGLPVRKGLSSDQALRSGGQGLTTHLGRLARSAFALLFRRVYLGDVRSGGMRRRGRRRRVRGFYL